MKKYILPILTALAPYLMVSAFLCLIHITPEILQFVSPLLIYFLILLLGPVLGIVCLVVGLRSPQITPVQLIKWNLSVKLAHIFCYAFIFLLAVQAMPLMAPFFFFFDAATLFLSGGFGIAAILRSRREGLLTNIQTALHILAHCFFVTDVLSAFLLWRKLKQQ